MRETNLNLCAGQTGKITFTELTGYTQEPTFRGGVKVNDICVDMQLQSDGRTLLIPPLPEGVWIYEVRADGATALWGRIRVMESPLSTDFGSVCWQGALDKDSQEVLYATLEISSGQQGAQGIQGPKGDKGDQGPPGEKGDPGITAEEQAYLKRLVNNTSPPRSTGDLVTGDDLINYVAKQKHLSEANEVTLQQCAPMFGEDVKSTPAGTANAMFSYIELDAQHVPVGMLRSISLRARSTGSPTTAYYLGVWEQDFDTLSWTYRGTSSDAVKQSNNALRTWRFAPGILLSGRALRLLVQSADAGHPFDEFYVSNSVALGVRTSAMPEGDTTTVTYKGGAYAFLPELSITAAKMTSLHEEDSEIHVSSEDRTKWNAAVAGNVATANALTQHEGDVTHLQSNGQILALRGMDGAVKLTLRGLLSNAQVTGNSLYVNVPDYSQKVTCSCVYSLSDSGGYVPWFAATLNDAALSAFGITAPGAYVGNHQYPLRLRGSSVTINGVDVSGLLTHKDDLLALCGSASVNTMTDVDVTQPLPASAYMNGGTMILEISNMALHSPGVGRVEMNTLFSEMPDGISMTVGLRLGSDLSILNGFWVAPWMGEYVVSSTCSDAEQPIQQMCMGTLLKAGNVVYYSATPMLIA